MGATVSEKDGLYEISTPNGLTGTDFSFEYQRNRHRTLMMAAVGAKGKTILKTRRLEPRWFASLSF